MTDLDDVLRFLSRSASWTCGPCGKYGTGFASWSAHREASPDCAAEQDREAHAGHVHVHLDAGPVTDRDPTRDVSAAAAKVRADYAARSRWLSDVPLPDEPMLPVARWWTVVDADGNELRRERRPYAPADVWWCGAEAPSTHALAFAETKTGPLFLTVPVGKAVTRGDRIAIACPASGGQVPVEVLPLDPVCQVPDCGCSGKAHP